MINRKKWAVYRMPFGKHKGKTLFEIRGEFSEKGRIGRLFFNLVAGHRDSSGIWQYRGGRKWTIPATGNKLAGRKIRGETV